MASKAADGAKRALLIAGVFPPGGGAGSLRWVKLTKWLTELGWELEVVAPRGKPGFFLDPDLESEVRCPVHRVGAPVGLRHRAGPDQNIGGQPSPLEDFARSGLKWLRDYAMLPDEYGPWALSAAMEVSSRAEQFRPHWLITSSFPYSVHLLGLWLTQKGRYRWWVDMRDPWSGHHFRGLDQPLVRTAHGLLQRKVMAGADRLTVVSPGMQHQLEAQYPTSSPKLLWNGYDPDDFALEEGSPPSSRDTFTLLYAGSFDARLSPPDPFLGALDLVLATSPAFANQLRVRCIGGADRESTRRIDAWKSSHPDARWDMEPFQSHRSCTQEMLRADALLLTIGTDAGWVMTSKVFDYLGSGRPILAAIPQGDCRDVLERCGGAVLHAPGELEELAETLRQAAQSKVLSTPEPDEEHRARFSWPRLARDVEAILGVD